MKFKEFHGWIVRHADKLCLFEMLIQSGSVSDPAAFARFKRRVELFDHNCTSGVMVAVSLHLANTARASRAADFPR